MRNTRPPCLMSLGHGYSAQALARILLPLGWRIYGTTRTSDKLDELAATGIIPILWRHEDVAGALPQCSHVLISAAPGPKGDPALSDFGDLLARHAPFAWTGYLSTTGVYGDHAGGWVDETTPLTPATKRGQMRVAAETAWTEFALASPLNLHIFRLAGIYGPGRGPFTKVRQGTARRIIKPGQIFSRIHVEDIAQVLAASINRPNPGAIYNLCDDNPAPPEEVIAHAARLLGLPVPVSEPWDQAEMSEMARSFYAESKRVRNDRIKTELGVDLLYPTYQTGLAALLAAET